MYDLTEVIKLLSLILGTFSTVVGVIYGYAKLNSKVDNTIKALDILENKTQKSFDDIFHKFDSERDRLEKREDSQRVKMDNIEASLSRLHIEVLKALKGNE